MEELYRSETIVVRQVAGADRSRWVITFDNFDIGAGFERRGFGEVFLKREGISAIHVLGRGNDWYHYPDVMAAAAVVREATAGAARRVAYGSSMGGYAAIRLADAIGADAVLAYSPQYSVDPAVVPWETRWTEQTRRLTRIEGLTGPIRCRCKPIVIFDPNGPDALHAALIEADVSSISLKIPFSGHPVTTFLREINLLRPILLRVLDGTPSRAFVRKQSRQRRRRSSVYFSTLAEQQPASRLRTAIGIARLSVARLPSAHLGHLALAKLLIKAGDFSDAVTVCEHVLSRGSRDPIYLIAYAEGLVHSGRPTEARAIATEVLEVHPDVAHLRHWYAWIMFQTGDVHTAVTEEKVALSLHPGHSTYVTALAKYESLSQGLNLSRLPHVVRLKKYFDRFRKAAVRRF